MMCFTYPHHVPLYSKALQNKCICFTQDFYLSGIQINPNDTLIKEMRCQGRV